MSRLLWVLVASGLLLGLPGCETADPNSAAYWAERLNGADRKEAIRKLTEMKTPEAVDTLVSALKDGRDRFDIIAGIAQSGDKRAAPALVEAFKDSSDAKTAQIAGETLLEWGVGDHAEVYINVAANMAAPKEQRYAALKLLAAFPDPRAESVLLPILAGDPDLQPIAFNGLAGEALGKLKSDKAIDALILCLWLDDHLGRNEVPACRLALNRIGPEKVVPKLIETLERKNRLVEARATKLKFNRGGIVEAKAAELLGDMPRPESVEPLIKAMESREEMPPDIQRDNKRSQMFVLAGVQKVISAASALATIGDDRAVEPLLRIASNKELVLEYRLATIQQLGFLGSPKAIPGLLKILGDDPGKHDPVAQGLRVQAALNLGNLLDGTDEKAMKSVTDAIEATKKTIAGWITEAEIAKAEGKATSLKRDLKGFNEWLGLFDKALAKVEASRACGVDPVCWGGKLADENDAVRMAAAYRLAQMRDTRDTALAQLMKHAGHDDLVLRNVILFGLDRLGDHSIVGELEKIRDADAEKAKKDRKLKGAVYTMDLMMAKVAHVTAK